MCVTEEWKKIFFGSDESDLWHIVEVEEITQDEARRCWPRVLDFDVFPVEARDDVEG